MKNTSKSYLNPSKLLGYELKHIQSEFSSDISQDMQLEEAWTLLKQGSSGFERFAFKYIQSNYIASRKPFNLAQVILVLYDQWVLFDLEGKYYQCYI